MPAMRGIRARLTVTLVALVALTAILLGVGAYLFVESSLHDAGAERCAIPGGVRPVGHGPDRGLPADPAPEDVIDSGLRQTFLQRGIESIIDVGGGQPRSSRTRSSRALCRRSPPISSRGSTPVSSPTPGRPSRRNRAWSSVAGRRAAGRRSTSCHDVKALEDALGQLRLALIVGSLILILLATLVARVIARGVLAPVEAASRAAERIERGDLSARVPVTSNDEFGTWAQRFNRMAEALGDTIGRLEAAEAQNRRFVADVAHELRTPLAALVAEASILREHLGELPPESRRAGELLVARRRSAAGAGRRPDGGLALRCAGRADRARAGRPRPAGRDGRRGPAAGGRRSISLASRSSSRPTRAGSSGSSATSSTTPASTRLARRSRCRSPRRATRSSWSVADRGPGVPPDRLDRIFERFYKADPSRHGGSSGLGLAIAAEHAALLGGDAERDAIGRAAACASSSGCL